MHRPLATIVTPSLNQGSFIRKTIESVLSQDYPAIEYIIMDGGSTDETASVVKDYASRLKWISEPDRGQSHAINKGFRMAGGDMLSWLNSDDWILPGAVARAARGFEQEPDAGAVYGDGFLADREGRITGTFPCTEPPNLWKLVNLTDFILQQTVYFRKSALKEIGELREDLHYAMDWDILIRIAKRFALHYIPEPMGVLREYSEAKSFSGGKQRIAEIARMLRRHTGKRFPPGRLLYSLNTHRRIWADAVRIPRLQWLIDSACGYWIERLMQSQGWRSDGSAGPRVKYTVSAGGERLLVISGSMPEAQELTVGSPRGTLGRRTVHEGDFEFALELPASAEPLDLTFASRRPYALRSVHVETCAATASAR